MSNAIDTQWFRHKIEDAKLSQNKIAEKVKIDRGAFSLLINGRRKMKPEEAARIAEALHVPFEEVVERYGVRLPAPHDGKVPVVGTVNDRGEVHLGHVEGPKSVPAPPGLPSSASALRLPEGWVVYYVKANRLQAEAVGRLAVVKLAGEGKVYLMVLTHSLEPRKWDLKPFCAGVGEGALTGVQIDWASPVEWIRT